MFGLAGCESAVLEQAVPLWTCCAFGFGGEERAAKSANKIASRSCRAKSTLEQGILAP